MINLSIVKIGLYARVSSEKQAQEKTINSQISEIIEYAKSLGERVEPELHFIDEGVSGAHLERPGLDKLRDKALSGEVTKAINELYYKNATAEEKALKNEIALLKEGLDKDLKKRA